MSSLLGRAIAIANRLFPSQNKPRALQYTFGFSIGPVTHIQCDIQLQSVGLEWIDGVFIDNKNNSNGFTLTVATTGQQIFVPANSQASMSLLGVQAGDNVTFFGDTTGGVDVPVYFMNIEGANSIWSTVAAGQIIGAVTVQGQVTALPFAGVGSDTASPSIITANTSQQVFAALTSRKRLIIGNPASGLSQNIGAGNAPESLFIRFGAAAVANTGMNFEIAPGGYFDTAGGPCDTRAVQIVGATAGHVFAALQLA